MIPMSFGGVLAIGFQLLGVILVTLQVTWEIVFLLIPLGWAYYRYQVLQLSHLTLSKLYQSEYGFLE